MRLRNPSPLDRLWHEADTVYIDRGVFFCDVHQGDGSWGCDDFRHNWATYDYALRWYHDNEYNLFELGDIHELWEHRHYGPLYQAHKNIEEWRQMYAKAERFHPIYGNHDMVKRCLKWCLANWWAYPDRDGRLCGTWYPAPVEALRVKVGPRHILVTHGHQVDIMGAKLWRVGRFFVRYLWHGLQKTGFVNPVSAATNPGRQSSTEAALGEWARRTGFWLIAGHTHKPRFTPPYFNAGSCVHPRCITAIEIKEEHIQLVKWWEATNSDGVKYITPQVLAGPRRID